MIVAACHDCNRCVRRAQSENLFKKCLCMLVYCICSHACVCVCVLTQYTVNNAIEIGGGEENSNFVTKFFLNFCKRLFVQSIGWAERSYENGV